MQDAPRHSLDAPGRLQDGQSRRFYWIFDDFGCQTGAMLATESLRNQLLAQKLRKAFQYWKSSYFFNRMTFPGPTKSMKNQSKIEVKMRRPLNIDFSLFFEDFWVPRRCKTAPGFAQDLSRRPKTPPRTRKIDWKSAQEILQSRLEGILEVSRRPPVAQKRPRTAQNDSRLRF